MILMMCQLVIHPTAVLTELWNNTKWYDVRIESTDSQSWQTWILQQVVVKSNGPSFWEMEAIWTDS